jgi:UDP-glucose 4-epimerase
MRITITGGAGFIGSHLAERLVARGDEVLVLDNFATGSERNVGAGIEVVAGHIAEPSALDEAIDRFRPELVVHCAASYRDPDDWEEDVRTNALGSALVARRSREAGVRRLVYFHTALCYGNRPLEAPISLAHPLRPESSYAISKTAGEQYIALSGIDFVSFRLANVYGPRNVSGPVPTFYQRLAAGKSCFAVDTRRDFVYVDDLLDVAVRAIDGGGSSGVYHVSSGSDISIRELYDAVAAAMALDEPVEERERGPDDAPTILLDPAKTIEDFGWRAATPLAEGIRRAIAWYEEHGVQETYTHLRLRD